MNDPIDDNRTSVYYEKSPFAGVSGRRRKQLMSLHRAFNGPFNARQAAEVLRIEVETTRRLLAGLADSGWLARVRKGWYISVPLEASEPREWREDPWVVAATIFSPSYIGGWSAVEHWGLTDQIFDVIYVFVGRKVTPTRQLLQGTEYLIRTVPENAMFGTRRVWRQSLAVNVSDPHRTIIDILDVPGAAGGILHTYEVLQAYFDSEYADQPKLLDYGDRLGRGTVFKRLGFLAERSGLTDLDFLDACHNRVTKGLSQLDPSGPQKGRIVARWNLRINAPRFSTDERVAW